MYVNKASKASEASSNGTNNGRIICEGGTEGGAKGCVRSLPSRSGQAFVLAKNRGNTVASAQVSSGIDIMHPCWGL